MATPLEKVLEKRNNAIWKLFESKFKADIRITVGSATCENAAGAEEIHKHLSEKLKQDKYRHINVALGHVGCSGRCDMEPVVTVICKGETPVKYMKMTPDKVDKVLDQHILKGNPVDEYSMRHHAGVTKANRVVSICSGIECIKRKSSDIEEAFLQTLKENGLDKQITITRSACHGMCDQGPVAYIYPDGVLYKQLTETKVREIVTEHFINNRVIPEYTLHTDMIANRFFPIFGDVRFYGKQLRLTLRNCGVIDPENIDEYLVVRGYEAAAKVLTEMTPEEVIDAVQKSGLRGRGGGGFSTGKKWSFVPAADEEKFIICNADEGDPGAFMDRSTIEGDPHTILEGIIIAGYAIGAKAGFIYIRAEYPLAIERLQRAIEAARAAGFLGRNIFGTDKDFDIELRLGAGAFVCGEETALIKSIEGKRGIPVSRPPFPAISGLFEKPTIINNVETMANIPVIILDGPKWFKSVGIEMSTGTKVFALAGNVNNTGLIEVPMGTTLREIVYDIGDGIPDGKKFKAIQTGGPAGGCLPESFIDTSVDYDSLTAAGSIMGSGGMIVMDEDTCMVDIARYFLDFIMDESCGKCVPCREGTKIMHAILDRITKGLGEEGDIERLLELSENIKTTALCGLGQTAPNPVISTITHFRDEYNAHIRDKRCTAGVCKELIHYEIDPEKCIGCTACARKCPVGCISGERKKPHEIDQDICIKCGNCYEICKFAAISRI